MTSMRPSLLIAMSVIFSALSLSASRGQETRSVTIPPAAQLPARSEAVMIGANVHYGLRRVLGYDNPVTGREQLAAVNAESFRDYLPWPSYQTSEWDAQRIHSTRLVDFLEGTRLKPLLNLGSSNSFLPDGIGIQPIADSALPNFAAYIRQAVKDTKRYQPFYEIWNEWNMDTGTTQRFAKMRGAGDDSDPRSAAGYVRMARVAVDAVRAEDPQATILVGAVGDDPDWLWAKAIVEGGALEDADGLSIHLYNHCMGPQRATADEMIDRAERLQTDLRAMRGGEVPIYISEFGWPTHEGECRIEPDTAAQNFAQFILLSASKPWIKGIWMHELKDIGEDPTEREFNFGLFTYNDAPKPAACFYREASAIVEGSDRVDVFRPFPDVFITRVWRGDRQKLVVWGRPDGRAKYSLSVSASGTPICGDGPVKAGRKMRAGPVPIVYDLDSARPVTVKVTG